jgi:olefin beta-lactone synthetase
MNIIKLVDQYSLKYPNKSAVVCADNPNRLSYIPLTQITFFNFCQRTKKLAKKFKHLGIKKGDKVLLFVKPSLDFPLITFALFRLGAIAVFIDPGMGKLKLFKCIKDSRPDILIAEPQVHLVRFFLLNVFKSIKLFISMSKISFGFSIPFYYLLRDSQSEDISNFKDENCLDNDTAAIIFTSGATGFPKGVVYSHDNFATQVKILREYFSFSDKDVDMAIFPLFALTSMAMGVTAVIPRMDASKPSKANPKTLVKTIQELGITTTGGSPAVWEKVADYCIKNSIVLPSLRSILMFGAPVSCNLHLKFKSILTNGTTYTPYGATESLPATCIDGKTILNETSSLTKKGYGTCVGQVFPHTRVKVVKIENDQEYKELPPYEIGEILVSGKQVTKSYWNLPLVNKHSKIFDKNNILWHKIGDLGYFDDKKRLWFCGRKVHAIKFENNYLYSVQCEAVFDQHPDIKRSALISCEKDNKKIPCIAIERYDGKTKLSSLEKNKFKRDLILYAEKYRHTKDIKTFFLHSKFPVDTRHNIKIDRKSLAKQFAIQKKM